VLCSRAVVGNEPFFVHLADDLIDAEVPCLKQMARVYAERGASVLGVETVDRSQTDKYGIVAVEPVGERVSRVNRIVEKPKPQDAPSNLAVVGRYILTPAVYGKLETIGRGAGGEIQLTDGIAALMADEAVYAYAFEGKRYDCGSKLGYLEATVEFGLKHENLGGQFASYLARLVADRLRG
jgi:UTP--glucose-1-phosphate uridylyltransferase